MLSLHFYRIKPGCEERLRCWLAELDARGEQIQSIFLQGGIRHEQAFIFPTPEGAIFVALAEFDESALAVRFDTESDSIDHQHRRLLSECLGEKLEIAPALDVVLKGRGP